MSDLKHPQFCEPTNYPKKRSPLFGVSGTKQYVTYCSPNNQPFSDPLNDTHRQHVS